jgi:hypothetical protein
VESPLPEALSIFASSCIIFPKRLTIYETVAPSLQFIPFIEHINPARASLVNVYSEQSVCNPYSDYIHGLKIIPLYEYSIPIIVSNVFHSKSFTKSQCYPGVNLLIAHVNLEDTLEDQMVMSVSATKNFMCKIHHTMKLLQYEFKGLTKGDIIKHNTRSWWQFQYDGEVISLVLAG